METERLENLIVALQDANPAHFDMSFYTWENSADVPCGTPGCVLGWYASRRDLQDAYIIGEGGRIETTDGGGEGWAALGYTERHFGLTHLQCDALFTSYGCNQARTPKEAIAYIRAFIDAGGEPLHLFFPSHEDE